MNIFAISPSPIECAQALDDKRLIKMCTETAQIFCTAAKGFGLDLPYKPTHASHPVVKWAFKSPENRVWCLELIEAIGNEYCHRFNKTHLAHIKMMKLINDYPISFSFMCSPENFENCAANSSLGLDFRNEPNAFIAYQKYLKARWDSASVKPKWTNREPPQWR